MAALGQPRTVVNRNFKGFLALALLRIRPGQRRGVVEVGISHAGEMAPYARMLRPDVAVVTSVGSEHHRALGGLQAIRAEKSHIVRVLGTAGTAVLNGDDPNVRWMREHTRARVTTFGFDETNDVRASDPVLDWPHGTRFRLHTREGMREVRSRLLGRPGVYAILAAVAVALTEGVALDRAIAALEALEPTPGRLQPVVLASGAVLLRDDFKSPEETILAALDVLAEISATRRIVVLGEVAEQVGSRRDVYRRLGERVALVASRAIFVTEHGRFRDYWAGARRAGFRRDAVLDAGLRARAAVEALRDDLGPGDVVLIKGRVSQRLARVALALMGRDVRCELTSCEAEITCDRCPMLERGW
jgi:UDP-N-acetylmuramoyl-tripeptide--D-alanyl-D-alanine ligase